MNLHRASKKADWETVSSAKRTAIQNIAHATHGFVTPANTITVIGLGIVLWGLVLILQGLYLGGLILVALGRLLDVADGLVADATKTKSPLGEMFDAAADKISTLLTILVLLVANIAPWWIITLLIIPQLLILAVVFYKKQRNVGVHPTYQGKISMALGWISVASIILIESIGSSWMLESAAYIVAGASFILGLYAVWQYATGRNQEKAIPDPS